MTLERIIEGCDVVSVKGNASIEINALCNDSRKVQENALFVAISGFSVENALVTEVILKFQMTPVVHGIPNRLGQRFGKLLKLFAVGRIAGDIIFIHAVGAHDAPLVVVTAQPNLSDVLETDILVDLLGIQMAVVVVDGHFCSVVMVQLDCSGIA